MRRFVGVVLLALILSFVLVGVAYASDGEPPAEKAASVGEIALLLAPLVAAAPAIERAIEMIFDFYENIVLSASRFLGEGRSYLSWARKQVDHYRKELLKVNVGDDPKKAEDLLADAEQRLRDFLKTEPYVSTKKAISMVLGIVLGLIVAFLTHLQMFKLLHVDLVTLAGAGSNANLAAFLTTMDIIVTGLVIGTGSAPVHSLIGILQNSKNAIDEARALAKGKSIEAIKDILLEQRTRYESTARAAGEEAGSAETQRIIGRMLD